MPKAILFSFAIIALLFFSNLPYCNAQNGQTTYTPMVDSLLNIIKTTTGSELLKQYPRLHKALYEVNDIDIHLKFNKEFAEAARAAKDKKMEAISHVLKVEAIYNYKEPDSIILAESLKALDFMQDVPGAEVHYFYTASVIGDVYIQQKNYDEALKYAQKFYNKAKNKKNNSGLVASLLTMGKAYEGLGILDKAEISFRESIAIADERIDHAMKGESYSFLVDMLNGQKRYNDALMVSKEFEIYLKRIDAYNGELKNLCFLNYLGYASSYTQLGQLNLARKYISEAEDFPVADTDLGMYSVENERFSLLLEEGKYTEAEKSLDKLESILEDGGSYAQAISKIKEARADLYFRWKKYDKAVYAYKAYIVCKDSLQRVEMAAKLNTLRTQYEVDKLEIQKEEQKRTFRNTVILLVVVLVLLCVIITIIVLNGRKLRAKNRSLHNRIREQDKIEESNRLIRTELAQNNISVISEDEEKGKLAELYLKLTDLMKNPVVFTDPNINRKIIADKLGTNEKYVFDTIHEYYNMSISDYITNLRLNYARHLLAHPSEQRNIETIVLDSGFNSRSTFYRLFKEHYGMTPAEFRDLVAKSLQ